MDSGGRLALRVCAATVTAVTGHKFKITQKSQQSQEDGEDPCDKFNSIGWRVSWSTRRHDCNALPSCAFIGRSVTGACVPRDPSTTAAGAAVTTPAVATAPPFTCPPPPEKHSDKRNDPTSGYDEVLLDSLDADESVRDLALALRQQESVQAVQEYLRDQVKEQLVAAALDTMEEQRRDAEQVAHETLREVLTSPEAGLMLAKLFATSAMEDAFRAGLVASLDLPSVMQSTSTLAASLVNRQLLTGGACDWTADRSASIISWSLMQPYTRESICPMLVYHLGQGGALDEPAVNVAARSMPYSKPSLDAALTYAASSALQGEEYRAYATRAIVNMLQSKVAQEAAAQAASSESSNVDAR
jgi:hypothetical protein